MTLSHNSLTNYFETNFALMQHHSYALSDLENLIPWERDIYVDMLVNFLKEQEEKRKQEEANRQFGGR